MPDLIGPQTPTVRAKRALVVGGMLALAASAVLGANLFGIRDTLLGSGVPASRPAASTPFVRVGSASAGHRTVLRSQPWWQGVARLRGAAGAAPTITIGADAIQWRAGWSCRSGTLVVRRIRPSRPLINASCPASGTATETGSGRLRLAIDAAGPWELRVDQQVDVPLIEPPLPQMDAAGTSIALAGAFRRIDQYAIGRVAVYRRPDGRYLMRLANFYVTPNVDLELRLSSLSSPRTTRQYLAAPSVHVAPLNITAGSLNFTVPATVDPTAYHSVVVWCPLISSAYAEAPLRPTA